MGELWVEDLIGGEYFEYLLDVYFVCVEVDGYFGELGVVGVVGVVGFVFDFVCCVVFGFVVVVVV